MVTGMACVRFVRTQTAPGQLRGGVLIRGVGRLVGIEPQPEWLGNLPTNQAPRVEAPQKQKQLFERSEAVRGLSALWDSARWTGTRVPFAPQNARGGV